MNSEKYGRIDEAWNLYVGRHFYGYPGFPTETLKEMVAQWLLRNEALCKNIVDHAMAQKCQTSSSRCRRITPDFHGRNSGKK